MELIYHSLWIWPVLFIKAPITLTWPVEEVDYDYIEWNSHFLVLSCYSKYLFLCSITKLALPEAKYIASHDCWTSYSLCKVCDDILWCITCCNPVIHFLCIFCYPCGVVLSEGCTSYCWIVPEEAIAKA